MAGDGMETIASETVKQHMGVDGFICWCFICGHRIIRRGWETPVGIGYYAKGNETLGYGHVACIDANGGAKDSRGDKL